MHGSARILVVCTANICRSPLGAALLVRLADDHLGPAALSVTSVGTRATRGREAAPETVAIARRWGVDLSGHRSQPVIAEQVLDTQLVLTMEEAHRDAVLRLVPTALPRTFTWLELARLAPTTKGLTGTPGSAERAAGIARAAHRARPVRPGPATPEDVADPVGRSRRHHRRMAETLVDSAGSFLPRLLLGRP